ncbi:MAG TPA: DUF4846 domain-containing protein [Puia sp.]|nr:DUF4846 domain-containing protein [Puia sp.]
MQTTLKQALVALLFAIAGNVIPTNPYPTVGDIPTPPGFHRVPATTHEFVGFLRQLRLKKDRTVYLYNGRPKRNQDAQFAVLDLSIGHEDLQQCADAVMRLRAEYLYANHDLAGIDFYTETGARLNFKEWAEIRHDAGRTSFDHYLEKVFMYCSTRTLGKALTPKPFSRLTGGDVLIHAGSPGHAMLVIDVAEDSQGHRIYLLAQGYMPAQDIHIVKNPTEPTRSPWYSADRASRVLETPEYTFSINELREWPKKP